MSTRAAYKRIIKNELKDGEIIAEEWFDNGGRLLVKKSFDANVVTTLTLAYNAEGKITHQSTSDNLSGSEEYAFEYDEDGRQIKSSLSFSGDLYQETITSYEGGKTIHSTLENGDEILRKEVINSEVSMEEKTWENGELVTIEIDKSTPNSPVKESCLYDAEQNLVRRTVNERQEESGFAKMSNYNANEQLIFESKRTKLHGKWRTESIFNWNGAGETWLHSYEFDRDNVSRLEIKTPHNEVIAVYSAEYDGKGRIESEKALSEEPAWHLPDGTLVGASFVRSYSYEDCDIAIEEIA